MLKKTINKKLVLKRETIANLTNGEMSFAKGGTNPSVFWCTRPLTCHPTYCLSTDPKVCQPDEPVE